MKTVFFVNCTDTGSTGKIIKDTAAVAKEHNYRCVLCAPNITEPETQWLHKYRVSNRLFRAVAYRIAMLTGNYYGIGNLTAMGVIRRIRREKADLVHIHCANGSFINLHRLLRWLKKNRVPTVVTNHAEFFYTGNCDCAFDCDRWLYGCGQCPRKLSKIDSTDKYWKKMKDTFNGFSDLIVTSVSPWVMSRSSSSPIMEGVKQRLVMNGVNTDVFRVYKNENVWARYGIDPGNRRVVLYVTACFYGDREEKGSKYLLELAKELAEDPVLFVIAGNHVPGVSVPENVHLLGKIRDQEELARLYSAADLTLITSRQETFSMPVAESLCCGTPLVGFCAGGPESVALADYSSFVPFGNSQYLVDEIRCCWLYRKTPELAEEIAKAAKLHFDRSEMAAQYMSVYEEVTNTDEPEKKKDFGADKYA